MAAPKKDEKVELGFLEITESWRLKSKYFPSKVGGKPAWLNLRDLPTDTKCDLCGAPLTFLLQIYAPVTSLERCFHRTIFVFFCSKPGCFSADAANRSFVAYRCQLPRRNDFYSHEPPIERRQDDDDDDDDDDVDPSADQFVELCLVCGSRGPKRCGRCRNASYCCREHQVLDWRAGHKVICNEGGSGTEVRAQIKDVVHLLPEFEIVTEQEENSTKENDSEDDDEEEEDEEDKGEDEQEEKEGELSKDIGQLNRGDVRDLEAMARSSSIEDKHFGRFRRRIDLDPEQVLRFQRGGNPLWISRSAIPRESGDIENCAACGSPRQFEFQILPQLLNHLKLDDAKGSSVDWGTLAIYTCSENCHVESDGYGREFVWKQDLSQSDDGVGEKRRRSRVNYRRSKLPIKLE